MPWLGRVDHFSPPPGETELRSFHQPMERELGYWTGELGFSEGGRFLDEYARGEHTSNLKLLAGNPLTHPAAEPD